jgi:transposase
MKSNQTLQQQAVRDLTQALHERSLSKQEYIRVHAVLLKKKGYKLKEVMDIVGKKQITIKGWITAYNKCGIAGLKTQQRTLPPRYVLLKEQKDHIKELVTNHKPQEHGLSSDFWSVGTLKQLVKKIYGVEYKTWKAYRDLLHYCGLSYQKVEFVDKRKKHEDAHQFKKRFEKKLKKGVISMWW